MSICKNLTLDLSSPIIPLSHFHTLKQAHAVVGMGKFCACLLLCECEYESYSTIKHDYRFLSFSLVFITFYSFFPIPGVNVHVNIYYHILILDVFYVQIVCYVFY